MVPPSRLVRVDDEMSVQETQKSRTSVPHFSASESAPPDVGMLRWNLSAHHSQSPRVAPRPSAMHIHKTLLNNRRKRARADDDFDSALLAVDQHDQGKVSGKC